MNFFRTIPIHEVFFPFTKATSGILSLRIVITHFSYKINRKQKYLRRCFSRILTKYHTILSLFLCKMQISSQPTLQISTFSLIIKSQSSRISTKGIYVQNCYKIANEKCDHFYQPLYQLTKVTEIIKFLIHSFLNDR